MQSDSVEVEVTVSDGIKCPRCWNYHTVRCNYDGLCDKCLRLIVEHFPADYPEAVANWRWQQQRW